MQTSAKGKASANRSTWTNKIGSIIVGDKDLLIIELTLLDKGSHLAYSDKVLAD